MGSIFERLAELAQRKQESDTEVFERLVKDVAADKARNADKVLAELTAIGKTPDELEDAVRTLRHRESLIRLIADEDQVTAALRETEEGFQAARQELVQAQQRFEEIRQETAQREAGLRAQLERIAAARLELQRGRRVEELAKLDQQLRETTPLFCGKPERESEENRQRREELMAEREKIYAENEVTP